MVAVKESTAIWIGSHLFYLDNGNILNVVPSGDVDTETAKLIKQAFLKLLGSVEGEVKILADLRAGGIPSIEARKVAVEIFNKDQVKRIAFFGVNPVVRIIATFIVNVASKKELRFFKLKEEAVHWLNQ